MRRFPRFRSFLTLLLLFSLAALGQALPAAALGGDLVLRGGAIHDGSGGEPLAGDVVVRGERILAVGRHEPQPGDTVIDCEGLIVAPGFIDLHTHSDSVLGDPQARRCLNYLIQGCTTMVTGNCGGGAADTRAYLEGIGRKRAGCNIIHLAPHGAVRRAAMGAARRKPTSEELAKMEALVDQAMRDGAWGMSTGLIYPPSSFAEADEITALAKVVAAHGGIYATHIRGESEDLLDSIREAIQVGRRSGAPVQVSHFKVTGVSNWGLVRQAAQLIEAARSQGLKITADQYPYTASSTSLTATTLPDDRIPGGTANLASRMAADPELTAKVRELVGSRLRQSEGIVIAQCKAHPEYVGKSIRQIAEEEHRDPIDTVLKLVAEGGAQIVNHGMSEDDVRWVMQLPWVATGSDGSARPVKPGEAPHPRNFGTFARKIGRYAIEDKLVPLALAVRSASGLPADILGIADRGYLRPGCFADIVVFDPRTYRDTASFDSPQQYATGVRWVFVAGSAAIEDGQPSEQLFGRALRHAEKAVAETR